MIKNKALSELFDNYTSICFDPWELDQELLSVEKKSFIIAFRTGHNTDFYINYARDILSYSDPQNRPEIITLIDTMEKLKSEV